jgi:hypothetical protein
MASVAQSTLVWINASAASTPSSESLGCSDLSTTLIDLNIVKLVRSNPGGGAAALRCIAFSMGRFIFPVKKVAPDSQASACQEAQLILSCPQGLAFSCVRSSLPHLPGKSKFFQI